MTEYAGGAMFFVRAQTQLDPTDAEHSQSAELAAMKTIREAVDRVKDRWMGTVTV